jgi:hypothetical protein
MATVKIRLDKLEELRTSKQAVFTWIDQVREKYKSTKAYATFLADHPEQHFDEILVPQVCGNLKDRLFLEAADPDEGMKLLHKAERRAMFLCDLFVEVNTDFWSGLQKTALLHRLALTGFYNSKHRDLLEARGFRSPFPESPGLEFLNHFAVDIFTRKVALERIQAKYFDDREILFKSEADSLAIYLEAVEDLAASWRVWRDDGRTETIQGASCDPTLDLGQLKSSIDPGNKVRDLVYPAKVRTLQELGKGKTALELARAWIRENAPRSSPPLVSQ